MLFADTAGVMTLETPWVHRRPFLTIDNLMPQRGVIMPEVSLASFEYDVAFSYAGEDRCYVRTVAQRLNAQGIRVFYDEFETTNIWGAELPEVFLDIFQKKARFAVAFISANYVSKPWPVH